ncbi:TraU family protein [Pseudomonas sp. PDM26]|uniref:TraU family protein n=1 Tax=Pseudomonas TaxID=286 RepID=UPI003526D5C8
MMKIKVILALLFSAVLYSGTASSETSVTDSLSCPNAQLFSGKLFTDVCWACLFPIRIAGVSITPGDAPFGASNKSLCMCEDKLGLFMPGIVNSMWEPARLIEVVRKPGCSLALGGVTLPLGDKRLWGTLSDATAGNGITKERMSFYNVHYYAFPLLSILEMYMPKRCSPDGYADFDIIQLSEIDPTWTNDELAFFVNPEAAAVANPLAQAACTADAALGVVGQEPLTSLWWCAGTWGEIYPMAGTALPNDFGRTTSLLAARTIATQHRRGLAHLTIGDQTICRGSIFPTIPKSQYKMSMFFPRAESKRAHYIGAHPLTWQGGEGRVIPQVGEDALYMLFRWNDCCNTL